MTDSPARAGATASGSGRTRDKGVVINGTGGVWRVRTEGGQTLDVSLRGRLKRERHDMLKLTVGDDVIIERDATGADATGADATGGWAIAEILPRRSQLARRMPGAGRGERIVAANVDQVVIVFAAANPEPHVRMLDRFLVIAEGNGLDARVVINKIELTDRRETEKRFNDYVRAGYHVHFTSVKQRVGLDELHSALAGRTSVLSGPSGVGKSSLMNSMYPGLNLRVGEISESVNKGRHTTVGAVAHPLPDAGYVVDTPGLREVGMWGMPSKHLDACFPELRPYLDKCRFTDCTHSIEPGCAVREAVERGDVSRQRYESFEKLRSEMEESEKKWADYNPAAAAKKRR